MEFDLEFFSNNRYMILKLRNNNQVKVKDDFFAPPSQQVIVDMTRYQN